MISQGNTLKKRVHDERLFSVDVSPKLRSGDTVLGYTQPTPVRAIVDPSQTHDTIPTELTVEIPDITNTNPNLSSEPVTDDKILNFYCGGGQSGVRYIVTLRYHSSTEPQLESAIYVDVSDDL